MTEGESIPAVTLTLSDGTAVDLPTLAEARPLVVYFYPKADTPGCTSEAKDFSLLAPDFDAARTRIFGVSKDSPKKLTGFAEKHGLSVLLGSDADGSVCEAFGVWVEKMNYGRTYMGIERATFLFGADGRLARAWRKVRVKGHAEDVLAAARAL